MEKSIEELNNTITSLKKENEEMKSKLVYHEYINSKAFYFKQKILFLINLLQFIGPYACAYGSIVRKFFDYSLRFEKSNLVTSGNVTGDINILFTNQKHHNRSRTTRDFYNIIRIFENSLIYQHGTNGNDNEIKFGNYKLVSIEVKTDVLDESGKIIPRAVLHFLGEYHSTNGLIICDKVMIKMMGWQNQPHVDYSVNSCMLTKDGIGLANPYSMITFFEFLENLCHNQTSSNINLEVFQENAFPKTTSVSREVKTMFLRKIYNFIVERYLRVVESGYQIVGYCPSLFLETKEECHLTSCKAPYPCLQLECGHKISLMGYKGIVENGDIEGTESIRCPMCRSDLKIKFTHEAETRMFTEQRDFSKILVTQPEEKRTYEGYLISQDSQEQL